MKHLALLFLTVIALGAQAGDLDNILGGPRRKVKGPTRYDRMMEYSNDRTGYHLGVNERIDKLNSRRKQLLHLVATSSKLKILTEELSSKCAGTVQGESEAEKCLNLLKTLIGDAVDLRLQLSPFAAEMDDELRRGARVASGELEALVNRLYRVLEVWTEKKYERLNAMIASERDNAEEAGRTKARCQTAPLKVRAKILAIDKTLARGDVNSSQIYQMAATHAALIESITEIQQFCKAEANPADLARSHELGQMIQRKISSPEFAKWISQKCAELAKASPGEVDCSGPVTPALLFTLGGRR
jgi:hypothetical protein